MQGCGVWRHSPLKLWLFCDFAGGESSLWAILGCITCSTATVQRLLWGLQQTQLFPQVSPSPALPSPAPAELNCSFWVPLKNVCVCGSHSSGSQALILPGSVCPCKSRAPLEILGSCRSSVPGLGAKSLSETAL